MIDEEGYRANVGIILTNSKCQLFWARRLNQQAWQFPQGGMQGHETPEQTLYRELYEEIGLEPHQVRILAQSRGWLRYRLPNHLCKNKENADFVGQKQKWFLLQLLGSDSDIVLDNHESPEFEGWQWVSYWYALRYVIQFKRNVYRNVLQEFLKAELFVQLGSKIADA